MILSKLGIAWAFLKRFGLAAFETVARYPWQVATAVLAIALAWLLWFTIPGLEREVEREAGSHIQTKENFRAAQVEAHTAWMIAQEQYEDELREAARTTDERERRIRDDALDAAESFIAANRMRQCPERAAIGGDSGGPSPAPDDSRAGSGERSGALPVMDGVIVQADDVRICTENTTRLQAAREWADKLNE